MSDSSKPNQDPLKILIAGGSGFIGSLLIKKLDEDIHHSVPQRRAEILCLTRHPESIKDMFSEGVRLVKVDVSNYEELVTVMSEQIDVACYLVHSMEGAQKSEKSFPSAIGLQL
jgi:nucleoside-diphosphate-sugar epimerase